MSIGTIFFATLHRNELCHLCILRITQPELKTTACFSVFHHCTIYHIRPQSHRSIKAGLFSISHFPDYYEDAYRLQEERSTVGSGGNRCGVGNWSSGIGSWGSIGDWSGSRVGSGVGQRSDSIVVTGNVLRALGSHHGWTGSGHQRCRIGQRG